MILKKLNAGSLQLVTFIFVIIALLLASFILLIHIHKLYRIKTDHIIETVKLVDKGIQNALVKTNNNFRDTIAIQLFEEDYKSLSIKSSHWGIFEKVFSKASIKNNTQSKIALIGSETNKDSQTALHINDNNKPLVLVGYTKIDGKAYLPKRGVKSGNIAGQSYYNEKYVYGEIDNSNGLPLINKTILEGIVNLTNRYNSQSMASIDLRSSKTHVNSFKNSPKISFSLNDIYLADITLKGHFVIQSKTKIVVDASSKLEDVILIAPTIEITSNVEGSFQAFANENIIVENNVNLNYPSALVLVMDNKKGENNETHCIEIKNNSIVRGTILALGKTLPVNYNAQIKIWSNAKLEGTLYCEQSLELRGTVIGSVYTDNFIIKEKGSIYQNHLFNAKITRNELDSQFVGISITDSKRGIAKWLY